jgi:hypothetical protein
VLLRNFENVQNLAFEESRSFAPQIALPFFSYKGGIKQFFEGVPIMKLNLDPGNESQNIKKQKRVGPYDLRC